MSQERSAGPMVTGSQGVVAPIHRLAGAVESTVRDAIENDYFVAVPSDCVAANTAELTEACLPAFQRLLGPDGLTSAEQLIAMWS